MSKEAFVHPGKKQNVIMRPAKVIIPKKVDHITPKNLGRPLNNFEKSVVKTYGSAISESWKFNTEFFLNTYTKRGKVWYKDFKNENDLARRFIDDARRVASNPEGTTYITPGLSSYKRAVERFAAKIRRMADSMGYKGPARQRVAAALKAMQREPTLLAKATPVRKMTKAEEAAPPIIGYRYKVTVTKRKMEAERLEELSKRGRETKVKPIAQTFEVISKVSLEKRIWMGEETLAQRGLTIIRGNAEALQRALNDSNFYDFSYERLAVIRAKRKPA